MSILHAQHSPSLDAEHGGAHIYTRAERLFPARLGHGALISLMALAVTALLPEMRTWGALLAVLGAVAIAWSTVLMVNRSRSEREQPTSRRRGVAELILHLSPVLLLMVIYPIAARRIDVSIGGTPLLTLLLASSVTVPWLSQPACLPLYRAIGDMLPVRSSADLPELERRLVAAWPRIFVQTLPAVLLFALPLQFAMGWSTAALGAFLALAALHLVFVQSVVVTNVAQRRGLWALSWLAYALALLILPTWWFLPPVAGAAVQLWSLRRGIAAVLNDSAARAEHAVTARMTWADVVKGFLLGSVLWGDKVLLFMVTGGRFDVQVVYIAMLPVVLAYNYYFVRLAPAFDQRVLAVRNALENESFEVLGWSSRRLVDMTTSGLMRTAAVGALLNVGVCAALILVDPGAATLAVVVSIASWLFMAATLLGYKLDYVGRGGWAMALGAAHLVLVAVALLTLSLVSAYILLIVGESVLVAAAATVAYTAWSSPSYTLFWRHATSW